MPNEDGSIGHAEIRIGDSVVMMFDGRANWPDLPAFLRLYVVNGDAVFARAIDAGAEPVTEMTELAWGDRVGRVRDPQGNVWWIQERIAELEPDEIGRRMAEPRFIEAMRYVQAGRPRPGGPLSTGRVGFPVPPSGRVTSIRTRWPPAR